MDGFKVFGELVLAVEALGAQLALDLRHQLHYLHRLYVHRLLLDRHFQQGRRFERFIEVEQFIDLHVGRRFLFDGVGSGRCRVLHVRQRDDLIFQLDDLRDVERIGLDRFLLDRQIYQVQQLLRILDGFFLDGDFILDLQERHRQEVRLLVQLAVEHFLLLQPADDFVLLQGEQRLEAFPARRTLEARLLARLLVVEVHQVFVQRAAISESRRALLAQEVVNRHVHDALVSLQAVLRAENGFASAALEHLRRHDFLLLFLQEVDVEDVLRDVLLGGKAMRA